MTKVMFCSFRLKKCSLTVKLIILSKNIIGAIWKSNTKYCKKKVFFIYNTIDIYTSYEYILEKSFLRKMQKLLFVSFGILYSESIFWYNEISFTNITLHRFFTVTILLILLFICFKSKRYKLNCNNIIG